MAEDTATSPYQGSFSGAEHRFALRVYYEDTDAGGVVYHANYLRFMERARSDMLRVAGIDQRRALDEGEGTYVVAQVDIRYARPGRLEDALLVRSGIVRIGGSSVTIRQRIFREAELLSDATVTAVFVTPEGRPRRQPEEWVRIFKSIASTNITTTETA